MDENEVFLVGRISSDLDKKTAKTGKTYVKFSLSTGKKNQDGTYSNDFHNVTMFGKMADEICAEGRKGRTAWVKGMLSYYDAEKQGVKVRYTNIVAFNGGIIKKDKVENTADKIANADGDMPDAPDEVMGDEKKDDLPF